MLVTQSMRDRMVASANRRINAKLTAILNAKPNCMPIYDGVKIKRADLEQSIRYDLDVIEKAATLTEI